MSIESIQTTLTERFSAPLPEFYTRRIIFWHDEDGAFAGVAEELQIDGVKVLTLTGKNNFEAKMLLTATDTQSNYLVYNTIVYPDSRENWLLGTELYSEEFRADSVSMLMEEMQIAEKPQLRQAVKIYEKFFDNKERRAKLSAFGKEYVNAGELHIDILAVLCGVRVPTFQNIIASVLVQGLDKASNPVIENIRKFGNLDVFWEMVYRFTGYEEKEDKPLIMLASHILLTALSQTMKVKALEGLEEYISVPYRAYCYGLIHDFMHSEFDDDLYQICRDVEAQLYLVKRFDKLEVEELLSSECFPCINECILRCFLTEIGDHVIKTDAIVAAVEKRRTLKWYKRVRYYYDGILQVAKMQQFYQEHITGFHVVEPRNLWKQYNEDYYKMDTFYRLFHLAFGKSLRESNTVLEDIYKSVAENAEGLYKNWFLTELGGRWTESIREDLAAQGYLNDIPRQKNFYRHEVKPLIESGGRVFVIVSDALRFDVAADLVAQLTGETKGNTVLRSCQAVFPTTTKFGMAALLPHENLALTDELRVTADGLSTEGIALREKVLKAKCAESVAIQYKDFIGKKMAERREMTNGKSVVYIYHNSIDAVGDKATTEDEVLEACETAIIEIKNLVRIITNELSGANILITADHGFLYTYEPLKESEKAEKDLFAGNMLEFNRRYAIGQKGVAAEHMVNVAMNDYGRDDISGFTPQENIRIKMPGGGENYVHGGISLQEMVIPVVDYKNISTKSKNFVETQKVNVILVSESRKISNSIFSLDFYQKEAVGGKLQPKKMDIYMTDSSGNMVSDKKVLIADKTDDNGAERMYRLQFNLRSNEFKKSETYYLVMAENGGLSMPEKTEFQIDIAFASDFDF